MANKAKSIHDEHTRIISLKPGIIGLDDIVLGTGEANLFNSKGVAFRQPDNILFDAKTNTIYNVEYKCNDSQSAYHHAEIQLKTSGEALKHIFPNWRIKNLYISGNYQIHVI